MSNIQLKKEIVSLKIRIDILNERILALEQLFDKPNIPKINLTQKEVAKKYNISEYKLQQLRESPEFQGLWTKKGRIVIIFPEFIELMLEKHSHYCRR